ncbi:unnamed protein product [Ectocarpus sp. CCAP 1310/34]|nr:unnamed protein product [Ectocarpus sp. CCAP 1310/34]
MSDIDTPTAKRAKTSEEDNDPWLVVSEGVTDVADAAEGQGAAAAAASTPSLDGNGSQDDEFDEELATLLADEPPRAVKQTPLSKALLQTAVGNSGGVRALLEEQAVTAAKGCGCETPQPGWDKSDPDRITTCGRQQAHIIAGVSIQHVLDRQKERDSQGDNVSYVLARTVRRILQYLAAQEIGASGQGNQCRRGDCFARAMGMFFGKGMEGIPRDVVLALLRY